MLCLASTGLKARCSATVMQVDPPGRLYRSTPRGASRPLVTQCEKNLFFYRRPQKGQARCSAEATCPAAHGKGGRQTGDPGGADLPGLLVTVVTSLRYGFGLWVKCPCQGTGWPAGFALSPIHTFGFAELHALSFSVFEADIDRYLERLVALL